MLLVDVDYGKNRAYKYEILRYNQTLFCDNSVYTFGSKGGNWFLNIYFELQWLSCRRYFVFFFLLFVRGNTTEYFTRFAKIFQSYKARV